VYFFLILDIISKIINKPYSSYLDVQSNVVTPYLQYVEIMYHTKKPYNNLPLLPPKVEVETKEVLKQTIATTRVLTELKSRATEIPNQAMLVNAVTLQEAKYFLSNPIAK